MKKMFQFVIAAIVAMSMTACSGGTETAENEAAQQEQVQPQAETNAPTSYDCQYFSVNIPEGWVNTGGESNCWLKKFREDNENKRVASVDVVPLPSLESVDVAIEKLMENSKYERLEDLKIGDHTFAVIKRNDYLYWMYEAMPKSGAVRVEIHTYDKENPVDFNNPEFVAVLESLKLK